MSMQNLKTRTLKISLVLIISAFVVELTVGIYSNSLALITDSIHAVLDSFVTAILLLAARWAIKPPDLEHTYGHGKIETMGGFIGGIVILFIAAFFIYESIERFQNIVSNTEGVMNTESIQMRRSGHEIFADVIISLSGAASFDEAHKISSNVEKNIINSISNAKVPVHFEPTWKDVPLDSKVDSIASSVKGVEGVHNVNSSTSKEGVFISLHVLVDRNMSLEEAHKVSDDIEKQIRIAVSNINHITVHLEPYISIPKTPPIEDLTIEEQIAKTIKEYPSVKKIGRVITLQLQDIFKIDIDCSFEGNLSIERVHDITSEIEHKIRSQIKNAIVTIHPEPN